MTDSKIIILGCLTIAVIAAIQGEWGTAGGFLTGGFALLKGHTDAKTDNSDPLFVNPFKSDTPK